jgi:hypothetical protein
MAIRAVIAASSSPTLGKRGSTLRDKPGAQIISAGADRPLLSSRPSRPRTSLPPDPGACGHRHPHQDPEHGKAPPHELVAVIDEGRQGEAGGGIGRRARAAGDTNASGRPTRRNACRNRDTRPWHGSSRR